MIERLLVVAVVALVVVGGFAVGKRVALRRSQRAAAQGGWNGADLGNGDVSVVLFTGPRCTQCTTQRWAIQEAVSGRARVGFVEFDASAARDLAHRFAVLSVPTTLVVDAGGEVLYRHGRVVSATALGRQLDKALAHQG